MPSVARPITGIRRAIHRVIGVKCSSPTTVRWRPAGINCQHGRRITRWRPAGRQNPVSAFSSYGQQQKGLQPLHDIPETATCRSVNCRSPTSTVANRFSSRRWRLRCAGRRDRHYHQYPDPVAPAEGIARAVKSRRPASRVTLCSDGNGSQPLFDAAGNLTGIGVAGFGKFAGDVADAG